MAFFMRGGERGVDKETVRTEVKTELKDLDYDKYLGTIGLAADDPKGPKDHYTDFPPAPSEGNWQALSVQTDERMACIFTQAPELHASGTAIRVRAKQCQCKYP